MWYVAAVFLFNLSMLASGKLNYCGARMCSHTNAHTFCQFPGGPGPQCIGYVETPLTTEEKIKLVIRLNQRRAAVASGRLRGFPTAGNMMKLIWMEELAREAQLWADQCEPPSTPEENDACRDLYSVAIGQCVASVIGEAPGLRPDSMVDIWYMQNMFYRGNITSYDSPVNNRYNYYGDFAQLVYSKTFMVGCGRSRFMTIGLRLLTPSSLHILALNDQAKETVVLMSGRLRSVERLVCNFAPRGPSSGRPLWTVASPGTACPPRSLPDDNVPALCAVQHNLDETHDQENVMSLEEHVLLETVFAIDKNESLNYLGSLDEIFLTKVAAATIGDTVTIPMESILQKRNLFEPNDEIKTHGDNEKVSTEISKPTTTVVLVGRPKSYNMDELNEAVEELNENPDTQMQDLPIKEKHFDVDYEFSESNEERRTVSLEQSTAIASTSTVPPTVSNIFTAHYVTEKIIPQTTQEVRNTVTGEKIAPATMGVTPFSNTELVNVLKDNNNVRVEENDTDALLEEYLSDPDTVRRLQEELDRMEQALSTATTKAHTQDNTPERAEKVRRALKDGVTYSDRDLIETPYLENSSLNVPQMLQMFSDDGNKSLTNPMLSMAMRYIPYFKDYKSDIMKSTFSNSNMVFSSSILVVICILCNVF